MLGGRRERGLRGPPCSFGFEHYYSVTGATYIHQISTSVAKSLKNSPLSPPSSDNPYALSLRSCPRIWPLCPAPSGGRRGILSFRRRRPSIRLEEALKEAGGEVEELSEEEKQRIAEEADDGW